MFSDSFQHTQTPAPFDIGKAIGDAFTAIGRNWRTLLVLATPLYLIPSVGMNYALQTSVLGGVVAPADLWPAMARVMVFVTIFSLIFQPLFVAAVGWVLWVDASGGRPDALGAARATLSQLPWLIIAGFLAALAYLIGFLLLIVPGIMASVAFSATLPSCVVEKLGPVAAMARSLELTRGQRWRLFGLFLVMALLAAIPGMVAGILGGVAMLAAPGARLVIMTATNTLGGAIGAVFGVVVTGSAYVQLRVNREGAGAVNVAEVFA
jgi:hypothetical protein